VTNVKHSGSNLPPRTREQALHPDAAQQQAGSVPAGTNAVAQQYFNSVNSRDWNAFAALFAPNVVAHGLRLNGQNIIGPQALVEHERATFA
jgi:hypothetical protein